MAVSAGAGMTCNVAPGTAAVPTQNSTGATLCVSTAVENVALTAAPPSGTNRIDVVTVHPRGNDLDGGSNNDWIVDVVTGTGASTPAAPAVPAGQLALAQVYVAGGTAVPGTITDVRRQGLDTPNYGIFARVSLSASVGASNGMTIPFNAVTRDPLGIYNTTSHAFTIPLAGHYQFNGGISCNYGATYQYSTVSINKGGTAYAILGSVASTGSANLSVPVSLTDLFAAGDVLTFILSLSGVPTLNGGNLGAGLATYMNLQYLHA
jgi:hypothetical protein